MTESWNDDQQWESSWWGNCSNTYNEETKQYIYARYMGLDEYKKVRYGVVYYDLGGKSVIDIGGGPVSLLLKCPNMAQSINHPVYQGEPAHRSASYVIDPLVVPDWVKQRYKACDITHFQIPAENFPEALVVQSVDEVWIYNCLQHVKSPEKIIRNCKEVAKKIRIFEWINTPITPGHPHSLTPEKLDEWLKPDQGTTVVGSATYINEGPCVGNCYYGVFDYEK